MTINTQNLTLSEYQSLRFEVLNQLETSNNIDPILNPIIDSAGIPTIGVGLNLRDVDSRNIVFRAFDIEQNPAIDPADAVFAAELISVINSPQSSVSQLRADLDDVLIRRANNPNVLATNRRTTFSFTSRTESIDAFSQRVAIFEPDVDGAISGVSNSLERTTLVSFAFNGGIGLIGPGLTAAFNSGDRAEAYYEIRYNTNFEFNIGAISGPGIARRRYIEAATFGLYDVSNPGPNFRPSETDALKVFRTFNKHEERISAYEAGLGGIISGLYRT
ncbi:hypothetical protein [Synechococcus sp. PCC 7336]|uniref:hypothetical protein n=1 Tax=Synechococcus sp. PCC 7336 TaxID=195250 RepID=UPI00034761FA|nr:hypothetical protein [Synechococcus sp. PCC 7336]